MKDVMTNFSHFEDNVAEQIKDALCRRKRSICGSQALDRVQLWKLTSSGSYVE